MIDQINIYFYFEYLTVLILHQQHESESFSLSLPFNKKPFSVFRMFSSNNCLQTYSKALTTFCAVLAEV